MAENIYDNFVHEKYLEEDDASSVNTDIPSDPWFDEQDIISPSPVNISNQAFEPNNDNLNFFNQELDESKLKEEEIDLYNDLVIIEEAEKRSKINHEIELQNLKKELEKLREADTENRAKIAELTKVNTNLMKNMSSMFKTSKSEIEDKDSRLLEANAQIDKYKQMHRMNMSNFRPDRTAKNQSYNDAETSNKHDHTRKRPEESLWSSRNEKSSRSNVAKLKNSNQPSNKGEKFIPESNFSISEDIRNSRDSTETNNLFFNLIPDPLKNAFQNYEQSQVLSLNRLKQSFINHYFNSDSSTSFLNLESNSKRPRTYWKGGFSNAEKNSTRNEFNEDSLVNNPGNNSRTVQITRSLQQDLVSLYKYKKEKIPFLVKRKFGLLKDGKDLIPENLL